MLDRIDETIVAVSSPPGVGALGVLRLSGVDAIEVAEKMIRVCAISAAELPFTGSSSYRLSDAPAWRRLHAELEIAEHLTVPAIVQIFRAPRSYTRQNLVEIHTVGSQALLNMIRKKAVALGASPAAPGEFTARAFLNGGMDLAEAEAVAGVIRAESDTQLRAARRMMDGTLTGRIGASRDELAELVALVEADIDFAEEPIEFITPTALRERLSVIQKLLEGLMAGATSTQRLEGLPHILLIGPSNAGKSALMNALSGTNRAICAAAAGTTRDILSAPMRLGRGEAILLDTAGVDPSEDAIIAQARRLTLSAAERVDLLCIVIDATEPDARAFRDKLDELEVPQAVIAANKCDLLSEDRRQQAAATLRQWNRGDVYLISALHGTGLDALRSALADRLDVGSTTVGAESVIITERQGQAIDQAVEAIRRAIGLSKEAVETIDRADILAFELREALTALGSVTGEVTTDDLLGDIFSQFCIGK
jgi:tRNA modification GTPase